MIIIGFNPHQNQSPIQSSYTAEIIISAGAMQISKQQGTVKHKDRIEEAKKKVTFKVNDNGPLSLICLNDKLQGHYQDSIENNYSFNSTDHGNKKYARIFLDSTNAKNC